MHRTLRRSTPTETAELTVGVQLRGADGAPAELGLRAAAARDGGRFSGYAMLWDTTDAYGTRFAPGCFGAGGLDTELYALLAMHDPTRAVGTFTAREDERGLYIDGGWDDTSEGRDARARARSGSADGLSVGFVPLMLDPDDENRFTQARLVEVSQITARMAAVPGAGFSEARARLRHQPEPTGPEPLSEQQRAEAAGAAAVLAAVTALSGARVRRR